MKDLINLQGCLLAMLLLAIQPATAAEVDQFTLQPDAPATLSDAGTTLAVEINRLLQRAVQNANRRVMHSNPKTGARWIQPGCDDTRLYSKLEDELARSVVGQLETFAEDHPDIARRKVALEQSIYRNFYWQTSPTLIWSERMASVINLAGVEIGTDKLGHFFTEGYSYFLVTEQLTKDIEHALLFGEWSESVYFGAQTTGVYSYADLVANFHGLRFWNRILARQPDPLTGAKPAPHIQCKKRRWVLVQPFDWDGYVDKAWHEGINCAALRNDDLLQRIHDQGARCSPEQIPGGRYGGLQKRLLNRAGLIVLPDHLQPEVLLRKRVELNDVNLSSETLNNISEMRIKLEAWRRAGAAAIGK